MTDRLQFLDEPLRIEHLFRVAEANADTGTHKSQAQASGIAKVSQESGHLLVTAAMRERERLHARTALLPSELVGDAGWAILLDIYISDQMLMDIEPYGCGARWSISDATAIRLIAGLIATNLVVRVHDEHVKGFGALRMTERGREIITDILERSA